MEYQLWALLLLIADRDGLRKPRPGTQSCILDAGAHDGATAVMLVNAMRRLDPKVYALEPLTRNSEVAKRRAKGVYNLFVYRLALGEVHGSMGYYPAEYDQKEHAAKPARAVAAQRQRGQRLLSDHDHRRHV